MENERLKELEEHIDSCGSCNYCGRPNTGRSHVKVALKKLKSPTEAFINEILKVIRNWRFHDDHEKLSSNKEFINTDNSDADKIISRGFPSDTLHPGAIYTSRLMSFSNLPKPRNSRGIQIEDPEVSDSQLIKLHVSEDLI
ncbi:3482_t:CDS:2 [Rhizophagus irregularis]|nr:3482_t:CDS:2 [Rhizophagus irregularis]